MPVLRNRQNVRKAYTSAVPAMSGSAHWDKVSNALAAGRVFRSWPGVPIDEGRGRERLLAPPTPLMQGTLG